MTAAAPFTTDFICEQAILYALQKRGYTPEQLDPGKKPSVFISRSTLPVAGPCADCHVRATVLVEGQEDPIDIDDTIHFRLVAIEG